jgi:hypothetical protein
MIEENITQRQTNGDRIRAMDNKQLAELLYYVNNICTCDYHDCHICPFYDNNDCTEIKVFKQWVNKEAEE